MKISNEHLNSHSRLAQESLFPTDTGQSDGKPPQQPKASKPSKGHQGTQEPEPPGPVGRAKNQKNLSQAFMDALGAGDEDTAARIATDLTQGMDGKAVRSDLHRFRNGPSSSILTPIEQKLGVKLLVRAHFEHAGAFLKSNGIPYLQAADGQVIELLEESAVLRSSLRALGIQGDDPLLRGIIQELSDHTLQTGRNHEVHWFGHLDSKANTAYLHDQGSHVYRITGESIQELPLTASPVGFRQSRHRVEFHLPEEVPGSRRFKDEILGIIPFQDQAFPARSQRLLLWAYMVSLLIPGHFPTRPILLAVGPTDSCKTSTLKLLGRTLLGSGFDVSQEVKDPRDFASMAKNTYVVAIDNVDSGLNSKLIDLLCLLATGGTYQMRKLYSNSDLVEIPLTSFFWISSRNPSFSREDLATRFLPIELQPPPFSERILERELAERVASGRSTYLRELVTDLQVFLGWKSESTDQFNPITRMVDFDVFAQELAAAHGCYGEMVEALKSMRLFQSIQRKTGEVLFPILDMWLAVDGNLGRWIKQKNLHRELIKTATGTRLDGQLPENPQKFGNLLEQQARIMEEEYGHNKRSVGSDQSEHCFSRMPKSISN